MQARGAVLVSSMDLQAKALNINMHQHNGECGCNTCEAAGQHVKSGKGWARHYPYNPNDKERTHESMMQNASEASTTGKVKCSREFLSSLCCKVIHEAARTLNPCKVIFLVTVKRMHFRGPTENNY